MKLLASLALVLPFIGLPLPAQVVPPVSPTETAAAPVESAPVQAQFSEQQLDQLLAPIALYPDALIALILPASTNPSDIVLAARFLQAGGLPSQADLQPWDDSVRGLAHYPQVIRWMDENLAWTKQLGEAFEAQPAEVMNAVQRLRARARAAGTLASTPQQQVIYQGSTIVIVPTDPNVIYVPYYDPAIVYDWNGGYTYSSRPFFTFSTGFVTGWWLCYGVDWHRHHVWAVNHNDRERYWREHQRDWHRYTPPPRADRPREVHVWQPRPDRHGPHPGGNRPFDTRAGRGGPGAPGFDQRRDGPPHTDRRDEGRPGRQPRPVATAAIAPRFGSVATPAVTPGTERRHEPGGPDQRRDFGSRRWAPPPAATQATGPIATPPAHYTPVPTGMPPHSERRGEEPRNPDFRPGFNRTAPSVSAPPSATPAPVRNYQPPRAFASPANNPGISTPPMRYTSAPPPAARFTPPPPAPARSAPAAPPPADRGDGGGRNPGNGNGSRHAYER